MRMTCCNGADPAQIFGMSECTAEPTIASRIPDAAPPATIVPQPPPAPPKPREIGGPSGPEPTRYGDWEHKGRCSDF